MTTIKIKIIIILKQIIKIKIEEMQNIIKKIIITISINIFIRIRYIFVVYNNLVLLIL